MRNRKVMITILAMILIAGLAVLSAFRHIESSWAFAIGTTAGLYFGGNVSQKIGIKEKNND